MIRSRTNAVSALLLVVLLSSGCSMLFVKRLPKDYDARESPDCTTSRVAPVIDTILTATNVASALYVAGQDDVKNKDSAVTLGLAVATAWASSAVYGYRATSQCIEAKEEDDDESLDLSLRTGLKFPAPSLGLTSR